MDGLVLLGGGWVAAGAGGVLFLKPSANATSLARQLIDMVMCVLSAWLSLYLLLGVSMAVEWELSLFWVPEARLCLCMGRVNENRMPFFPQLPQPHLFKQKAEREREGDPAGQGGRNNNIYPWATFQHMQPFYTALKLLFRQKKSGQWSSHFFKTLLKKKKKKKDDIRPKGLGYLFFSPSNDYIWKSRLENGKDEKDEGKAIWL